MLCLIMYTVSSCVYAVSSCVSNVISPHPQLLCAKLGVFVCVHLCLLIRYFMSLWSVLLISSGFLMYIVLLLIHACAAMLCIYICNCGCSRSWLYLCVHQHKRDSAMLCAQQHRSGTTAHSTAVHVVAFKCTAGLSTIRNSYFSYCMNKVSTIKLSKQSKTGVIYVVSLVEKTVRDNRPQ